MPPKARRLSRREYAIKLRCESWGVRYTRVSRAAVFRRSAWVCQLCQEPVDRLRKFPDPGSASLDHVVPLSRGGHHVLANCQLAHLGCNSSKGAREMPPSCPPETP